MKVAKPKLKNEELIVLAKNGDEDAKEEFFGWNTRLCYHLAQKYTNIAPIDDLVGMGKIGLIKAYNTFDPTKNILFATYASRLIVNEILMFARKDKRHKGHMSMEQALTTDVDGNQLKIEDILSVPEEDFKPEDIEHMQAVLEKFKKAEPRLYDIINYKYFLRMKQQEIAEKYEMSQSYVSRLETRALKKLRKLSNQMLGIKEERVEVDMANKSQEIAYVIQTYPELATKEVKSVLGTTANFVSNMRTKISKGQFKSDFTKINTEEVDCMVAKYKESKKPKAKKEFTEQKSSIPEYPVLSAPAHTYEIHPEFGHSYPEAKTNVVKDSTIKEAEAIERNRLLEKLNDAFPLTDTDILNVEVYEEPKPKKAIPLKSSPTIAEAIETFKDEIKEEIKINESFKIKNQISSMSNKLDTISLLSNIISILSSQSNDCTVELEINYKVIG